MANAQPVTISLTPEMAAMVRQKVEQGEYSSVSEVVREALRDWSRKHSGEQQELDDLRLLLKEAIESGPGDAGSAVFARLRARYSQYQKPPLPPCGHAKRSAGACVGR